MRSKQARKLTAAERRALALSPGLIVTRYAPGKASERAVLTQLKPESDERRQDFGRGLSGEEGVS